MNTSHKTRFAVATIFTATLALTSQLRDNAHAQCYFDPLSGQRICAISPETGAGARAPALDSRPGTLWVALDSSAHCRINVGDGSVGSGVLVARDESTGLVLTCSHLFDDATGRIIVAFPNGKRYAALLVARDQSHDLAALSIRRPKVAPLSMSKRAPAGTLSACGFGPNGQFRAVHGNVIGQATAAGAQFPSLTIQGAVRPGDSGGGVLNAAGQLVGIVWGQRDGLTYATCGQPVHEFLKRVIGRGSRAESQEPNSNSRPQPPAPSPQLDWQAWSTEIERRIQSLNDNKQDKGDYLQPGDLNGYVRMGDLPKLDEAQLARRDELDSRFTGLAARFDSVRNHFESIDERIKKIATGRIGFFEGLSFGKLLVATLGLSGPLAAAAVIASGLAGRRMKKLGATQRVPGRERGAENLLPAPGSSLPAPTPIAVDTPPPPQRTVPETHYVPYEKDSFAKAHQWASEQVARKYPGATEVLQAQDSLIKQFLNAQ